MNPCLIDILVVIRQNSLKNIRTLSSYISRPEVDKKKKEREKRLAFHFDDGSKYNGEWIGNKRDGYGVMEWKGNLFTIQMGQNMKGIGKTIRQTDKEDFYILMEITVHLNM